MKDEEKLAEEYVKSVIDVNAFDWKIVREISLAFLAGLKAGRPKWHKVAYGDLPKEHKIYLVAIKDNGLAIAYFNGRHWVTKYNLGDFGHCVETVIAWCEIPTFIDKE